jgi:hypothetical protein
MKAGNVEHIALNPATATPLIMEVAETSENVKFTRHAEEKMIKRGITRLQVLRCLKKGHITEGPAPDIKGGWTFRMETLSAGDPITVIGSLYIEENGNKIVVITSYQ